MLPLSSTKRPSAVVGPPLWAIPLVALALLLGLLWRLPPNIPYASFAFAGSAVIFLGASPTRRTLLLAAAAVPVLSLLYSALHLGSSPIDWTSAVAVGAGSVAIGATALLAWAAEARELALRRLCAVVAMPAFVVVSGMVLNQAAPWHPLTFDSTLTAVDQSVGFDPSFAAGRLLAHSIVLWWTSKLVYDSLPFALCLVTAARSRRFSDGDSANVLASALTAAAVAVFLFQLLPACGPRFLWRSHFPFDPPAPGRLTLGMVTVAPDELRNALPSLHLSGSLIVAWALRPFPFRWRFAAWLYVAFTVIGTLGSGEHYLVDLIVAAPFALGVELLVRRRGVNALTVLLFAIVSSWLIGIRWFSPVLVRTPGLTITAFVATIAVVTWLLPQLESHRIGNSVQDDHADLLREKLVSADRSATAY